MLRRPTAAALAAALISGLVLAAPARAQEVDQAALDANIEGLTVYGAFSEFGDPVYPPDFAHFDYVNPDAPSGGHLVLSAYGTFERLDTITIGGTWPAGIGLTGDSLFTGTADALDDYYASIAESVALPDDLSYAVFTIREEARWHDGEPIVAADFVFAFDIIKEHARPLLREFYRDLVSVEALNDRQLRVEFATTGNWATVGLAAGLSPWPQHWWEASGRDPVESYLEPVLYEGPYTIESVDPGRRITYRRVEDYWAEDLPVNVGQNNFDRITYIYFRDVDVMFEAFLAGEFDFWSENQASRWATGYNVEPVNNGAIVRDDSIADNSPRGYVGFVFNTRRPQFQDIRVREALGYLWDFEWTRANIFYGQYARAYSYFPNSDYGTQDYPLPTEEEMSFLEPLREQIPESVFTEPFTVPSTDGSGRIRENLRTALGLFREAGWEIDGQGRLVSQETGEQMEIEFLVNGPTLERVILPFVENLEAAGIDASLRVVDPAQWERRTDEFDYDMIYIGANFFPPPGGELRTYFESAAVDDPASANWPGIADPAVDQLLDDIVTVRQERDEERLQAVVRALDRVLLRDHWIIPSYYLDHYRIAYWDIFGQPEESPEFGIGFPTTWWYDPERAAALPTSRNR
ncbi:MAG: extracellular solute-binding protein [Azospirillaceae bacterium]